MTNHSATDGTNAVNTLPPRMLLHQEGRTWEQVPSSQETYRDRSELSAIRTVVVPLDGSQHAEHALPYAAAIARRSGATLRLVHVHWERWQMYSTTETDQSRKRDKQEYLRDVADRIEYTHAVASETIFIESIDLEDSLVRATSDADLVVIASRRRGFLLRLFSYSVTDQLRRRLRVPTLFVRGRATPVDLTADPIARHILIPLDGSALAERILGPASAIGRLAGATFTLLNVQDQERTNGVFEHTNPPSHLIAIAGDLKASASAVDAHAMTTDQPLTSALTSFAEGRKVDLIALATRSDGGITRLLRGSITDKLIRRTDIPILQWNVDVEEGRPDVTTVVE